MPATEDPFTVARPPGGFNLYETRDERFSERLSPYFAKGRADVLRAGRRNLFVRAELAVDGVLAFTAEGVWKRIQLRPQRAPERNP